jgi:hypothetical protein
MFFHSLFILFLGVYSTLGSLNLIPVTHRASSHDHDVSVDLISNAVKNRGNRKLSILRSISQSHCPRPQSYKGDTVPINIANLTHIIDIEYTSSANAKTSNSFDAIVDVQPGITFEALVDALAPLGLIPAVVPEFKGKLLEETLLVSCCHENC